MQLGTAGSEDKYLARRLSPLLHFSVFHFVRSEQILQISLTENMNQSTRFQKIIESLEVQGPLSVLEECGNS